MGPVTAPPGMGSLWRKFWAGCIVAAGVAFLLFFYSVALTPANTAKRDYIEYWAAGRQLAHHGSPYDIEAIYRLERQVGLIGDTPRISFSPPVALEFALPLGFVGPKTGLIAWWMVELSALLLSLWLLWRLLGRPDSRIHLVGLVFVPTLACQMAGQLAIFFLVCVLLFFLLQRSHPWIAGAALMPLALKPHLFVSFGLILLLWCFVIRRPAILGGAVLSLAASCGASLLIDPMAWQHYGSLLQSVQIADAYLPTIGMELRFLIHQQDRWIGFIPEIVSCGWAVWYYWTRRDCWNWLCHGSLLLMVSVLAAPYAWFSDQVLLFPAILLALYRVRIKSLAFALFVAMQAAALIQLYVQPLLTTRIYLWQGPTCLLWYWFAMKVPQAGTAAGHDDAAAFAAES